MLAKWKIFQSLDEKEENISNFIKSLDESYDGITFHSQSEAAENVDLLAIIRN